jgi:hypothetical protein
MATALRIQAGTAECSSRLLSELLAQHGTAVCAVTLCC